MIHFAKILIAALVLYAASLTTGCGAPTQCHPTGELGSCCSKDDDCNGKDQNLKCTKGFPGGYCSYDCAAPDHHCPEEGQCVHVEYSGTNTGIAGDWCLRRCGAALIPCREDYNCRLLEGTEIQICFPL